MASPILTDTLTQISYIVQDALSKVKHEQTNTKYVDTLLKTIADQAIRMNNLENELDNFKLQSAIQSQAIADLEKRLKYQRGN